MKTSPPPLDTSSLTPREIQTLANIGKGLTTKAIAAEMSISPKTVETFRDRLREKLKISSAHELRFAAFHWMNGRDR